MKKKIEKNGKKGAIKGNFSQKKVGKPKKAKKA